MLPAFAVPAFGGQDPSFLLYEKQERLWRHVANLEHSTRASASILQTESVARHVCMPAGGEMILNSDGADWILNSLREYFSPNPVATV